MFKLDWITIIEISQWPKAKSIVLEIKKKTIVDGKFQFSLEANFFCLIKRHILKGKDFFLKQILNSSNALVGTFKKQRAFSIKHNS